MKIIERPSPNHDARPEGAKIDILVLHYTGMRTAEEALVRLTDPVSKVSAHYTIDRDGSVYAHVPEERRAFHAGVSWWAGERNVNARSIGIELVNPGHEFGYVPFPDEQIAVLIDLAREIVARRRIPASRIVGHSDVAPARKTDPGELFPWDHLAEFGIGLWASPRNAGGNAVAQDLRAFGYGLAPDVDTPLSTVVTAFQRHFRPTKVDGLWDIECARTLDNLLAKV